MTIQSLLLHKSAKPIAMFLCSIPFFYLLNLTLTNQLGANPEEFLIRGTGDWVIRFICLTLLVSPLKDIFKITALARFRRIIGVSTFVYGTLHLMCYLLISMSLDFEEITKDILKRPFIWVGIIAWIFLLALAATSFDRVIKAMGAKTWKRLHNCVFAIAALGVLHFYWMKAAKHNFSEVKIYGAILAVLILFRMVRWLLTYYKTKISSNKVKSKFLSI